MMRLSCVVQGSSFACMVCGSLPGDVSRAKGVLLRLSDMLSLASLCRRLNSSRFLSKTLQLSVRQNSTLTWLELGIEKFIDLSGMGRFPIRRPNVIVEASIRMRTGRRLGAGRAAMTGLILLLRAGEQGRRRKVINNCEASGILDYILICIKGLYTLINCKLVSHYRYNSMIYFKQRYPPYCLTLSSETCWKLEKQKLLSAS